MPGCPRCGKRAPKRSCPALGTKICAVCCARERMLELACPESCDYLRDARARTAEREAEWRARERDAGVVYPELPERLIDFASITEEALVDAHRGVEGLELKKVAKPTNDEVVAALENAIQNLQTGASGLIYEHHAASPRIEELGRWIRAGLNALAQARPPGQSPSHSDLIGVLKFERTVAEGHVRRREDNLSYLRYTTLYVPWREDRKSSPLIVLK